MDRFIVTEAANETAKVGHLKSNMDRFIVFQMIMTKILTIYLKSNMDRFIDAKAAGLKIGVYI